MKRPLPLEAPDLRDPLEFSPGAQLWVRERAAASAEEVDVTPLITGLVAAEEGVSVAELAIDIKDLESSFDGKTLIFAARVVPEPVAQNLEQTTWNLWLLDMESLQPEYLIPSRIKRNEGVETGGGHDIAPYFLGDDRIVFSSTRQVASQARQLNEGRAQIFAALDEDLQDPAAVLHVYDPLLRDREFQQISFNLSHDLDPVVLASGEVVFSRWNNSTGDHVSLFRIAPDGSRLSPLYGFHSQYSGSAGSRVEFTQPREMDDGALLSLIKPFASVTLGGNIVVIDAENYTDAEQPAWNKSGVVGPGQSALTDTSVRTDGELSAGGQFGFVYPLRDGTGRLLVTWSQCRVVSVDERIVPCTLEPDNSDSAAPLYGAWVYDPAENTQAPVILAEEGYLVSEIVALEARAYPKLLPAATDFNAELALAKQGQLLIDSVYDVDGVDESPLGIPNHSLPGTVAYRERPARFLRIVLPVPIPDDEVIDIPSYAAGLAGAGNFREIAGYVPVEPDGSVSVVLAANQAFSFSVLDAMGRRLGSSHRHWLQLGAGEVLHCTGCHRESEGLAHGRLDAQPLSANAGAVELADGGYGFPATDISTLFAFEPGNSMAQTWDYQRPLSNPAEAGRRLALTVSYSDEWTGPGLLGDPDIDDRAYDPAWTDIPDGRALVVDNLDPTQPSRIVINYIDHIQPIWERQRASVSKSEGLVADSCTGCHNGQVDVVAAGQLDLTEVPSDLDPDHMRSYRELLSADAEQWLDAAGNVGDRTRLCTEIDEDGNVLTLSSTVSLRSPMRAGSAAGSGAFFACFEGGACGPTEAPPLPDNCSEDGGTIVPATRNTVNHIGMLSASELRLISEWLDIGGQYYNNPFDSRLQQ